MSKNITIQEGGASKQLTADKLKTNLVGGGACLWVPEDEVQLGTKTIAENGTYKASDDGYYGYYEVSVNVPGGAGGPPGGTGSSVIGKDADGDEAITSVDGSGNLQTEKVPSSIEVITPPTNPYGIYVDGQTISTDGMVVKAYLETGGEYGTVTNAEVTLNPATAAYDESKDEQASAYDETIQGNLRQPIPLSHTLTRIIEATDSNTTREQTFSAGATTGLYLRSTGNSVGVLAASEDLASVIQTMHIHVDYKDGRSPYDTTTQTTYGLSRATVNGKTFYWGEVGGDVLDGVVESYTDIISGNAPNANDAYVLLYGEKTRAGSPQTITVSWPRPGDGAVLETTFEILVAPGYGGDEGENGNAGTPPPGMLIP